MKILKILMKNRFIRVEDHVYGNILMNMNEYRVTFLSLNESYKMSKLR